jgi:hypothetical protein
MESKNNILPCPFCGQAPVQSIGDPGAPYPGGYFTIECLNKECNIEVCLSVKKRTDLEGMTYLEAREQIWPEIISKWNARIK